MSPATYIPMWQRLEQIERSAARIREVLDKCPSAVEEHGLQVEELSTHIGEVAAVVQVAAKRRGVWLEK